jgi:YVTN family beta-propeller protein
MFSFIRSGLARMLFAAAVLTLVSGTAAASPKVYVGNFKDNTVSVIDTASGKVTATVPVAAGPHGMAISSDGRWVYVSGDGSSTVSVIDTSTDSVAYSIEVGKGPHGNRLTPDGKLLLVGVNGDDRIAFVDTEKQTVIATTEVAKPHTIAITPNGKLAYVASQAPGNFALVIVDISTHAVVGSVKLDKPPRDLEIGHDGKALYFTQAGVNAVRVLDLTSDKIVAEISTGVSPHMANLFPNTTLGIALVQGPSELLLFDPATNKAVRSIGVGKQPHWVSVSGDGKTAYVSNEGENNVSVVDLDSGKAEVVATVGNAPRKLVIQP